MKIWLRNILGFIVGSVVAFIVYSVATVIVGFIIGYNNASSYALILVVSSSFFSGLFLANRISKQTANGRKPGLIAYSLLNSLFWIASAGFEQYYSLLSTKANVFVFAAIGSVVTFIQAVKGEPIDS
jgi:hypothetical protein